MGLLLSEGNYPAIRESLLGHGLIGDREDPTFPELIDAIIASEKPDIWLFTANSAIPLADTLRGHYAARKLPTPSMGYVRADRHASYAYHTERAKRIESETERLGSLILPGMVVTIVDECYVNGLTMKLATDIVSALGVPPKNISAATGCWYTDTLHDEVNPQKLTSTHSAFMYETGVAGALRLS